MRARRLTAGTYNYQALTDEDSFRLIKLHPARDKAAEVICEIIHTTLREVEDSRTEYTALSYVWGDSRTKCKVYVKDCALTVTSTIETALRHVRGRSKEEGTMLIWADGISINQENWSEKSQQVQQMGEIYKNAHRTTIFLGEYNENSEKVVSEAVRKLNIRVPLTRHEQIHAMGHVLLRPWFHRVWVLQELVLSPNPIIQIGGFQFPWRQFLGMCRDVPITKDVYVSDYDLIGDLSSPFKFNTNVVHDMARVKVFYNETRDPSTKENLEKGTGRKTMEDIGLERLLMILAARRGLGASDPRDLVFAHLGMVNSGFQVDYGKSKERLYNELARKHIVASKSLEVFSHVEHRVLIPPMHLPSWVPDWTLPWLGKRVSMMHDGASRFSESALPKEWRWLAYPAKDFAKMEHNTLPTSYGIGVYWLDNISTPFRLSSQLKDVSELWTELIEQCESVFKRKYSWGEVRADLQTSANQSINGRSITPTVKPLNEGNNSRASPKAFSQSLLDHFNHKMDHPDEDSIIDRKCLSRIRIQSSVHSERSSPGTASLSHSCWALVPVSTIPGDMICFLQGSSVPFVVRRKTSSIYSEKKSLEVMIVGECFVEGAMYDQVPKFLTSRGFSGWRPSKFILW